MSERVKDHAQYVPELGGYEIIKTKTDGTREVRDTMPMIETMSEGDAIKAVAGFVAQGGTQRRAYMSLFVLILDSAIATFGDWKGAADKTKPIPKEMTQSFQRAEDAYFARFLDDKHESHKVFVANLPKQNKRGEALEVGGKLNRTRQFDYFMSDLRSGTPAYMEVRSVMLSLWGYVGHHPRDKETGKLIPLEAIKAMVAESRQIKPADNGWATRAQALIRELLVPANPSRPVPVDGAKIAGLIQDTKAMLAELERLERIYKAGQAAVSKPGDRVDVSEAAERVVVTAQRETEPAPM